MGCASFSSEIKDFKQETVELDLNKNIKGLSYAKSLICLITRIRNKIIYLYHKLIYDTGACVFINPTIAHCLDCILYKVSSEYNGNLRNAGIAPKEDPPYLKLPQNIKISQECFNLFEELFNFIIELISYKAIIKQIDLETPELFYLIHEQKNNLSKKNIDLINKGINLFKNMKHLKSDILNLYKNELYEFAFKKDYFYEKIDSIGKEAFKNKITNIYEIAMLKKTERKENDENTNKEKMFKTINDAKAYMENIINNEKNDDIFYSHESIFENLRN